MKKIYALFVAAALCATTVVAQNDTLLFQNFNTPFDTLADATDGVSASPSGNDLIWVNYDEDGTPDASGRPQNWYWQNAWLGSDSATQGGVMVSSSWLQTSEGVANNWLILPPLYLSDASTMLSWKSAPYQGPRYMDGYKVVVSAFKNHTASFDQSLFVQAQMDSVGTDTIISTFHFTNGYVHASHYTDANYFFYNETLNGFHGLLEPHSVSLAAFAGYTVYIAFVHDSQDDNLLALDDILVTGSKVVSTQQVTSLKNCSISPNPAQNFIRLNYETASNENIDVRIFDVQGRLVKTLLNVSASQGVFQETIDVSALAQGTYELVIFQNGQKSTQPFVKLP